MSREKYRIYVGNLPSYIKVKDIEELFCRYGRIEYIDLKQRRDKSFAFVEFEDHRDAEDAVNNRDGYRYYGYRLKVEFPFDGKRARSARRGGDGRGLGGSIRRSEFGVVVTGLPLSGSWQDLKDHMREAGIVLFAETYKDGTGIVEFLRHGDMKYAVRNLDDSRFRSHQGESAYIRVKEYSGSSSNDYDRSRTRSYTPPRGRTRGTPPYSPKRSSSRSRSRSRSSSQS